MLANSFQFRRVVVEVVVLPDDEPVSLAYLSKPNVIRLVLSKVLIVILDLETSGI